MYFFEKYNNNIIKNDLIIKFNYKKLKSLPKLKKVILNFGCKTSDFKKISIALLALKLITKKQSKFVPAKKPNVLLKIRKGEPVGCKIILTKKFMFSFLGKLLFKILPYFKYRILFKQCNVNSLTFNIKNILIFKILEQNYILFNTIDNLHLTLVTCSKKNYEFFYLLNLLKL